MGQASVVTFLLPYIFSGNLFDEITRTRELWKSIENFNYKQSFGN